MENILEKKPINFERKNLLMWIGSMNGKPDAWVGTQKDGQTIEYKTGFEDRIAAVNYIVETMKRLSAGNTNEDNLREEDIQTIRDFFEKDENEFKLETKEILKD